MTNKFLREDGSWVEPEGAGPGGATDTADVQLGFQPDDPIRVPHSTSSSTWVSASPEDTLDDVLRWVAHEMHLLSTRVGDLTGRVDILEGGPGPT